MLQTSMANGDVLGVGASCVLTFYLAGAREMASQLTDDDKIALTELTSSLYAALLPERDFDENPVTGGMEPQSHDEGTSFCTSLPPHSHSPGASGQDFGPDDLTSGETELRQPGDSDRELDASVTWSDGHDGPARPPAGRSRAKRAKPAAS